MRRKRPPPDRNPADVAGLRIIGGKLRGRKLQYSGDPRTRPMKDRVREAVFNLLGRQVVGTHAIDLFAGTGALGLEALSRGAAKATLIERHLPTARLIEQNCAALGVADQTEVVFGDAFHWSRTAQLAAERPLLVLCSPPYDFYVSRQAEMLALIEHWLAAMPAASACVVEADDRFDVSLLPRADTWRVRSYPPAVIGIYEQPALGQGAENGD